MGSSWHSGTDVGFLGAAEKLTLMMGRVGYGTSEFCEPKTKPGEATCHVLYGCNRLFHGRSFPSEVNPKINADILGKVAGNYANSVYAQCMRIAYFVRMKANSATPGSESRAPPITSIELLSAGHRARKNWNAGPKIG